MSDGRGDDECCSALTLGGEQSFLELRHMALITDLYLQIVAAFDRDEDGQGLAEYALILALIAIVAIVALIFLGGQTSKILSTVGRSV